MDSPEVLLLEEAELSTELQKGLGRVCIYLIINDLIYRIRLGANTTSKVVH